MLRARQVFAQISVLLLGVSLLVPPALADGNGAVTIVNNTSPTMVFGFLGGFVGRNDSRHPGVKFVRRLHQEYPSGVEAAVFENRRYREAYKIIRERLDVNHDGTISDAEKQPARIVLFGNSWGGAAVVNLARKLNRDGIPIALTVQVDSVTKLGHSDAVIPPNVHRAVNYYQTHGWVRGRRKIVAADPERTTILGNFLLSYDKTPVECEGFPWYDNIVTKAHVETECDPKVWSEIEALVRRELPDKASNSETQPSVLNASENAAAANRN